MEEMKREQIRRAGGMCRRADKATSLLPSSGSSCWMDESITTTPAAAGICWKHAVEVDTRSPHQPPLVKRLMTPRDDVCGVRSLCLEGGFAPSASPPLPLAVASVAWKHFHAFHHPALRLSGRKKLLSLLREEPNKITCNRLAVVNRLQVILRLRHLTFRLLLLTFFLPNISLHSL